MIERETLKCILKDCNLTPPLNSGTIQTKILNNIHYKFKYKISRDKLILFIDDFPEDVIKIDYYSRVCDSPKAHQRFYDKVSNLYFGCVFAKIYSSITINGYNIYVQERLYNFPYTEMDSDSIRTNSNSNIYDILNELGLQNTKSLLDWCQNISKYYGYDILIGFLWFSRVYKMCDLNSNNLGYTKDGVPKIIDF